MLRVVAGWSRGEVLRLACQRRPFCMCPFVDVERWICTVYDQRPTLCRLYGYARGLECPYAPELAQRFGPLDVRAQLGGQPDVGPLAGVLGVDINWPEILDAIRAFGSTGQPGTNPASAER